ncbi:MAG: hypothetical protein ABWY56_10955, partial [Propionibacteriaceae bacterium]
YPAAGKPYLSAAIQYDVNDSDTDVVGVAAVLVTQHGVNSIEVYPQTPVPPNQNGKLAFDTSSSLMSYPGTPNALLWANTPAAGQWQTAFSNTAGDIIYVDQSSAQAGGTPLYAFGSPVNSGDLAAWVNDGAYTFTVLAGGVVGVMSQAAADGPFSLPIRLVDGVERIYSAVTDPTQSTLFTVMADTTLSVLTRDPTTGWTQHQVHQDTADMQQVDSYRAMISILDANGVGVAGAQAQITTDRVVGLWQEPSTNTILEPGPYATVTADEKGKISVSIPAEELDCATLSVQALGPDGQPVGTKFVVTPHIDVANFFAGNTTLYGVGSTLNGSAMQNAGIFPNLNGASGATAAAAAVNHMATLGLNPQATDGDTQSALFDMSTSTPSFESSPNPNAYTIDTDALDAKRRRDAARVAKHRHHGKHHPYPHPIGDGGGVSDWWNSVKHDADSAFHGLRHGAIKFKKMVTSWAGDVKQWTVNLIVDIGDGFDSLMSYVVDDIKSAIHAISSFFQALGADIKAGVDWVKNHVIDYLKDADANAKIMQGWFAAAIGTTATPGPFYTMLSTVKADTNGYLNNLAAEAHTAFQNLEEAVGDQSFGDAGPLPDMTTYTGAVLEQTVRDVTRIARFVQQSPAMWLLHKLEKHLPHGDPGPTPVATFQPVVDDLATDFSKVLTVADDIVTVLKDTAVDLFPSREGYSGAKITQWLTAVDKTVEDSIALLEAVIDTLLDLMKAAFDSMIDTLNYQIPVLGDGLIGWIFKKAGIDPTLSVGHLVALVASYPATLYSDVSGHGPLFPATPVSAQRGRGMRPHRKSHQLGDGNDGWEIGLGITAAVVQSIWGLNDVVVDVQIGTDEDGNTKKAPAICDWIDIFAPILLTILQWPSATDSNGNTMPPFYGGVDHSTKYDWMLPWIIISALCPPTMTLIAKRVPFGSGTNEPSPQNVKDPLADYYGPIIQMVSGIVNTAIGTAFSVKTSAGGSAIAGGVLGNLSYMLAVLAQKYVNEPAADGPMMVKMTVDFAGNIGAGVCIAESTSLPPK